MRRWPLVILALLPACEAAQGIDARLRQIDLLDRVFEPERFRPAPAPDSVTVPVPDPAPIAIQAPDPGAAAPWFPEPEAEPAHAPDPALRTQALLRQQPCVTRFWSELTPAQQARVGRRLPRDTAARWDGMGLPERVTLLFGAGG